MNRYIDADAYERELRTSNIIHHYGEQIVDKIHSAPSIDIVRCKECKYYKDEWCYWRDVEIRADDFCSYGVKKGLDDGSR